MSEMTSARIPARERTQSCDEDVWSCDIALRRLGPDTGNDWQGDQRDGVSDDGMAARAGARRGARRGGAGDGRVRRPDPARRVAGRGDGGGDEDARLEPRQ